MLMHKKDFTFTFTLLLIGNYVFLSIQTNRDLNQDQSRASVVLLRTSEVATLHMACSEHHDSLIDCRFRISV